MSVKTFVLDGRDVTAGEEQSLLDVALENGIRIPRLCHLEGLSSVGACRLCLVEIAGVPRLQPACVTRIEEGMVVQTNTERIQRHRRGIVELLFAERNHVCSVCVVNGHCELQDLAYSVGMNHVRFPYRHPALKVDASHIRFTLDHNRCVLCTRCVRACDQIEGAHTWDVAGRGERTRVVTDLDQPWGESASCTGCGKCVQVCPTGALFQKIRPKAEMEKDPDLLSYLKAAREQKLWTR